MIKDIQTEKYHVILSLKWKNMIPRILQKAIKERLFKGKALLIFGPRQCGKSTLVEAVLDGKEYLHLTGDDSSVREILSNTSVATLKTIIGKHKILFIDEAQRVTNIGLTLKLITDHRSIVFV